MLIGYVSDERFVALPDVLFEFEHENALIEARSSASGAVHADIPVGSYQVTVNKLGYGAKRLQMTVTCGETYHFRLLADCLLGYPWPKWLKSGEHAEFRVHSPEAYELELWRYGLKKELVQKLGWHDEHGPRATVQITPDGDYSRTGVQWNKFGYADPTLKQHVVAPERSGLYYFHARTNSGLYCSFPWIVAPEKPKARLAILASNITWNAYNSFGGRSNYINADQLPKVPIVNSRQELHRYTEANNVNYAMSEYAALSFDRPELINLVPADEQVTDPIEGRTACHLAPAEWRLLGWLEREGFEYDFYAETQLHFGALNLNDYHVLIISTHPEYWSRKMYSEVKDWVQMKGGRLLYLGGNGINCEVDFLDHATMVVKNGDERERIRRGSEESRQHASYESEANLLGVVFTTKGAMTSAPYQVVQSDHWAFAETGLNNGDKFGEETLHRRCPGGASGHETDKMSPHSPVGTKLLAKGINPDDGGAHMTIYETSSGGGVFSVGSICWPSSILIDEAVSKITANVLRRFLLQDQDRPHV